VIGLCQNNYAYNFWRQRLWSRLKTTKVTSLCEVDWSRLNLIKSTSGRLGGHLNIKWGHISWPQWLSCLHSTGLCYSIYRYALSDVMDDIWNKVQFPIKCKLVYYTGMSNKTVIMYTTLAQVSNSHHSIVHLD